MDSKCEGKSIEGFKQVSALIDLFFLITQLYVMAFPGESVDWQMS